MGKELNKAIDRMLLGFYVAAGILIFERLYCSLSTAIAKFKILLNKIPI